MKRQLIFGTMLSATLAVGVAAQQPPATGSTPPAGQPPSDRPSASQSLTLTGCLKEAPGGGGAAATGSPGWSDGGRQSGRRWIHPHRRETGRVDGWWRNGAWRGDWHSGRGCDRNDRQRERSVDLSPDGWR